MAAPNVSPVYSRVGDIQWGTVNLAANTALDGTGTVKTIFTADATNGGLVQAVRGMHAGTNIATAVRIFVNNGLTNATAANNWLLVDFSALANTISQTLASVVAFFSNTDPFPLMLPPGYTLLETQGTAVAAGISAGAIAGKY